MKQDVVEYMTDSFVDFNGVERKIVACALSQTPEPSDDGYNLCIGWTDAEGNTDIDDNDFAPVYRVVTVGIAVCNPVDKYDEEVGKKTAYNKALHDPKCPTIITKDKGVASRALVAAFMRQEVEFTKSNPERIIAGYNRKKERFDKREKIRKEFSKLSEAEQHIVQLAQSGVDILKYVELAKKAKAIGVDLHE